MLRKFSQTRTHALRTPVHRAISFVQLLVLMISTAYIGTAQAELPALTEREAVSSALARPAWLEAEAGRVAFAESAVTEGGVLPNPVFAVGHERIGMTGGDATEHSVQISQTFDVSGRRMLRREAAGKRVKAERFDGQIRRLNAIAEVRRAFAETLYRDQIQVALGLWLSRIEKASEVAAQLAKAGEVSGYDRRRLEREAQATRLRLAVAQADAARSREVLAVLTGKRTEEVMHPLGDLLPDATPAIGVMQASLRQRPDLASLVAQSEAFEQERQAAERAWIPDMTLGIGQKHHDEPDQNGSGTIVGMSFSLPLFDRGEAAQQRSHAKARTVRAEHALALAKAEAELRGMWHQANELRKAALAYRSDSPDGSHSLSSIAVTAYRAGETGLLELLDAYRAELDFAATELDLALRARLARIDLETLSGVSSYE